MRTTWFISVFVALAGCGRGMYTDLGEIRVEGRRLAHPAVQVGEATMILDTGAEMSVVAGEWLVESTGRRRFAGNLGTSFGLRGEGVPIGCVEDDVALPMQGVWNFEQPICAIEFPEVMTDHFEGILSPQELAGERVWVLDLRRRRVAFVPPDDAHRARGAANLTTVTAKTCGVHNPGAVFLTEVDIEGTPVQMMVDTGAHDSILYVRGGSGAYEDIPEGEWTYGIAGGRDTHPVSLTMRVGGVSVTTEVDIIEQRHRGLCSESDGQTPMHIDGVLGLDVLSHCTLVVEHRVLTGRCE